MDKIINTSEHYHIFKIPVEWAYRYFIHKSKEGLVSKKYVTKLRCECGEEWIRSDNE